MTTLKLVRISERAAIGRINRVLAKQGQALRKAREGSRSFHQTGRFFILDVQGRARGGYLLATHCNLEELARELNVLGSFETIDAE